MADISTQVVPDGYKGPAVFCSYTHLVEPKTLKPNPRNPNKHPRKQLSLIQKIVEANGWRSPIVVSRLSGLIVKGEGRYQASLLAGWTHIPVDYQDYASPDHEWADLIADNEIAKLADMDKKKRLEILQDLDSGTIDLEITGIPMRDLEEMFNESRKDEGEALYPMAAQLHEKYDYVLIFTDNETDRQHLHEIAGIRKEVSYKMNKEVGLGRSIPLQRFLESLKKARLYNGEADPNNRPASEAMQTMEAKDEEQ